ncbi:hypothetical protein TWF694_007855 [Orbilia ellipsospora]|uniref:Uncharacterized protein n=1 Tax=Orbilia ellipsospora TaxID=2528407 RepID=A0AAV9XJE7_9PEZI
MKHSLLSLVSELRLEILRHLYKPNVIFYYRKGEPVVEPMRRDTIALSYEILPIPKYLLKIHPQISEDVKTLYSLARSRMGTAIDNSLIGAIDSDRFSEFESGRFQFVDDPSPEMVRIIRDAKFVMDIPVHFTCHVLKIMETNEVLTKSIRYICFRSCDNFTLRQIFKILPNIETLAFYCGLGATVAMSKLRTPGSQSRKELLERYAARHVQLGRTTAFSRLEYIYGVRQCDLKSIPDSFYDREIVELAINCTRRRLRDEELDERGRIPFIHNSLEIPPVYIEDFAILYEFVPEEPAS